MTAITLFQVLASLVCGLFLVFGLDVRRKSGARNLVSKVWQITMKLCSFSLLGGFMWLALSMKDAALVDWVALATMACGLFFVVAAKRALGSTHSVTGTFKENPQLVTHGVYRFTRNPLYLGAYACELGVLACALHQVPLLLPDSAARWLGALGLVLAYTIVFTVTMARREMHELEAQLGEPYRRYRSNVPFLLPRLTRR